MHYISTFYLSNSQVPNSQCPEIVNRSLYCNTHDNAHTFFRTHNVRILSFYLNIFFSTNCRMKTKYFIVFNFLSECINLHNYHCGIHE